MEQRTFAKRREGGRRGRARGDGYLGRIEGGPQVSGHAGEGDGPDQPRAADQILKRDLKFGMKREAGASLSNPPLDVQVSMGRFVNIANFCILCKNAGESHDHLFFDCPFSSEVWNTLCHQAGITWPYMEWNRNIEWASCNWNGKNAMSLSFRLTLAAAVYFIWSERNRRTFGDANGRSPNHIANLIIDTVWRKLEISIKGDDWRTRNVIMLWSLSGDPTK